MKNKITITTGLIALALLVSAGGVSALSTTADVNAAVNANTSGDANTTTSVKAEVKTKAMITRIDTAKTRAAQEIDRRVESLTNLLTRVNAMVRVSAEEKASIASFVQGQIDAMAQLKTKIAADVDLDPLKIDIKSITDSYRVYMLVIPQGHVIATTDAMVAGSDLMASLGAKLQVRIEEAKTAGQDTKALETLLTDYAAQINDAKVQAQAAVTIIAPLTPDSGDKATQDANKKAFADAKAKIKLGRSDLQKARDDAAKIVKALKSMKIDVNATASTTMKAQ